MLHLVNQNQMDIYDINLNKITDQYLDYIKTMQELNLEITSEFLVMASNLLYIKSKKLLPKQEKIEDELTEEELIAQIIKYKQFKEGAIQFRERYNQFKRFFGTPQKIELPKLDLKDDKLDSKLIYDSYKNLINKNQARLNKNAKNIDKIAIVETYSVGDSVKTMFKELIKHSKFVFNKLFNNRNRDSKEVVTAFSGLLEMSRRSKVSTNQKELFGDIYVGKWWKQIALIILIIACVINISIKIVNRPSFKNEMQSSAEYFQDLKSDADNKLNEIKGNLNNKK